MGLDMQIVKTKKIKPPKKDSDAMIDWYDSCEEVAYWRKFYDLHDEIIKLAREDSYESGEYIKINEEVAEGILKFCCKHRDYFCSFDSVPSLCELLENWDQNKEEGYSYYYEADW